MLTGCGARRFLRARKFDVEKAKQMIAACEQWRKDFGVDELWKCVLILTRESWAVANCTRLRRNFDFKEKEAVDKYYPQYYHKTDKVRAAIHLPAFPR